MADDNMPAPPPVGNAIPFCFEGAEVRVIERGGEPWFVLADVCRVLDVENPRNVTARLDDDEKGVHTVDTLGGPQEVTIINESGLYSLILTSRKPAAKRFKKWVTAEVLPTIRKTGGYGKVADPMKVLNDPAAMRGLLLTYTEKVLTLEAKVQEQAPVVAAFDRIANAEGSLCISDAAKALGVAPKTLFDFLRSRRWTFKRHGKDGWLAYQEKLVEGVLEHKVSVLTRDDGTERVVEQVRVTAKGLTRLARLLRSNGVPIIAQPAPTPQPVETPAAPVDPRAALSRNLRRALATRGWSQSHFADRCAEIMPNGMRMCRDNISGYARGLHLPDPARLLVMGRVLGCDPEGLLRTSH